MAELLMEKGLVLKDKRGRSWVEFEWVIDDDLDIEAEDAYELVRVVLSLEQARELFSYLKAKLDPQK